MSTMVIWGAGSGLGASMVEYFHERNFEVIGIARHPNKNPRLQELNIKTLVCDATNKQQVEETVNQLPKESWVISSMGGLHTENETGYVGHRHLINALDAVQVNRFLLITSLGCGDSWQYLSDRAKQAFGHSVREKSLDEAWLQSSTLNHIILRPGGLKDGDITNNGKLSQHDEVHGLINRSEVARLAHQLLEDDGSLGEIYQCVDVGLSR